MPLSQFGEFDGDSTANQFAARSQRIRSAVSAQSPWSRSVGRTSANALRIDFY